jgi:endonuclease G
MLKKYFALSYNNTKGIPNWVSWQVSDTDLGEAPRKRIFDADLELPAGFRRITHQDYNSSGFDRGHMCPHSDRAANEDMSYATFVMTNIIPQAPAVNEKAWAHLESYCRSLVRQHHERLYIIAGPYGEGGTGTKGFKQAIGKQRVTVPAECWKIIVVVPAGGGGSENDLAKIHPKTRVITVLMPNDETQVGDAWAPYRTTPAEIERKTGFRFFTNLPPETADALRQKTDTIPISSQD